MNNITRWAAAVLLASAGAVQAQEIIGDTYDAVNVNNGFLLGEGLNSGINPLADPPVTRLTGTAASGLRYMNSVPTQKPDTSYLIDNKGRMQVSSGARSGRATMSADGSTAFDFGPALGVAAATAAHPITYDIKISMQNNNNTAERISLAVGTVESSAGDWDFGLQLYRPLVSGTTYASTYTVQKRFDTASTGLASDVNLVMFAPANAVKTQMDFLIRVTDAGAQTTGFNSNIKVSIDGGTTWVYNTSDDTTLVNGFRFDGAGRFFSWDVAGGNSGAGLYDNFSVALVVPEPGTGALVLLGGFALLIFRRKQI